MIGAINPVNAYNLTNYNNKNKSSGAKINSENPEKDSLSVSGVAKEEPTTVNVEKAEIEVKGPLSIEKELKPKQLIEQEVKALKKYGSNFKKNDNKMQEKLIDSSLSPLKEFGVTPEVETSEANNIKSSAKSNVDDRSSAAANTYDSIKNYNEEIKDPISIYI